MISREFRMEATHVSIVEEGYGEHVSIIVYNGDKAVNYEVVPKLDTNGVQATAKLELKDPPVEEDIPLG